MIKRVTELIVSMLYFSVFMSTRSVWRLFGADASRPQIVLMYHNVAPQQKERFAKQMRTIAFLVNTVSKEGGSSKFSTTTRVAVTFDDAFVCVLENALPELQRLNIPATVFVPTGYIGKESEWIAEEDRDRRGGPVLDSASILKVSKAGVQIGSHTVRHKHLALLDDKSVAEELRSSKYQLEAIVGVEVVQVAFPFGSYDERVIRIAKNVGYNTGYANIPVSSTQSTNGFLVGRISASPDDWICELLLKAVGAYQWLVPAIKLKRLVSNLGH